MRLLFLDNDRVLNCGDKDRHENRYLPLHKRHVVQLNRILRDVPDLQIVVSSAWRYHVHSGDMTLKGLASMYAHFGINVFGPDGSHILHGVTAKDPHHWGDPEVKHWTDEKWHAEGLRWRNNQIWSYVHRHIPHSWIALDDLPLKVEHFVQTNPKTGLTSKLADEVIRRFRG